MRELEAAGFGDMVAAPPPLSPVAEMALDCWAFSGGWHPERWPVYEALNGCPDWAYVIDLMRVIRSETQKQ